MFFFNNCVGRDYVGIYGIADAFYDLGLTGFQGARATDATTGDTCVVATTTKQRQIRFTRFRLDRVETRPDEHGERQRVFCGPVLHSETLAKTDAARDGVYGVFFDKNGNFKRHSVLQRR